MVLFVVVIIVVVISRLQTVTVTEALLLRFLLEDRGRITESIRISWCP